MYMRTAMIQHQPYGWPPKYPTEWDSETSPPTAANLNHLPDARINFVSASMR